jgi:two-component system, OmpR family, sensor kinase
MRMGAPLLGRLGLRLKLTLVFAGAMALVFSALALFVYVRVERGLDRSLEQGLRSRAEDVRALVLQADSGLSQAGASSLATPGERFAQILSPEGKVLDATPSLRPGPLLTAVQLRRSSVQPVVVTRTRVSGFATDSRLLAIPVIAQDRHLVVVVGSSLRARDSALADLRTVFLLGGPVALLVASLLGYGVAMLSLLSVESMRRRARHISLGGSEQRLPVPPANDELARLARTLNEMLARNEAAFERERAFVANASHELRSPLAILRAELDVALVGESSRSELEAAVRSAADEVDGLSRLADALLVLAESDRGSLPLHRELIDVAQMLEQLRERASHQARAEEGVVLSRARCGLRMWADPLRLKQALGNLIDNALRHGGRTVVVRAESAERTVVLQVSDDGPGFPPEFLDDAFERFTRADSARTGAGAGLGLSIVRSIARAHGGEAHACNRAEGGAVVSLLFPDSLARGGRSVPDQGGGVRA